MIEQKNNNAVPLLEALEAWADIPEEFQLQGEVQQVVFETVLAEAAGARLCVGVDTPLAWIPEPGSG